MIKRNNVTYDTIYSDFTVPKHVIGLSLGVVILKIASEVVETSIVSDALFYGAAFCLVGVTACSCIDYE